MLANLGTHMRVAVVLFATGCVLLYWLKRTRHVDDTPKWKPDDHTITNNRNRR